MKHKTKFTRSPNTSWEKKTFSFLCVCSVWWLEYEDYICMQIMLSVYYKFKYIYFFLITENYCEIWTFLFSFFLLPKTTIIITIYSLLTYLQIEATNKSILPLICLLSHFCFDVFKLISLLLCHPPTTKKSNIKI